LERREKVWCGRINHEQLTTAFTSTPANFNVVLLQPLSNGDQGKNAFSKNLQREKGRH
jgi:hypothetical protein